MGGAVHADLAWGARGTRSGRGTHKEAMPDMRHAAWHGTRAEENSWVRGAYDTGLALAEAGGRLPYTCTSRRLNCVHETCGPWPKHAMA